MVRRCQKVQRAAANRLNISGNIMFKIAISSRSVLHRSYALEALGQRQGEKSCSGEQVECARARFIRRDQSLKFIYQKTVALKERTGAHAKIAAGSPVLQGGQ